PCAFQVWVALKRIFISVLRFLPSQQRLEDVPAKIVILGFVRHLTKRRVDAAQCGVEILADDLPPRLLREKRGDTPKIAERQGEFPLAVASEIALVGDAE